MRNFCLGLLRRLSLWIAVTVVLASPSHAAAQSSVKMNGGKCPIVNGKPFFAIGMYSTGAEDFPALAKAGFNVVHNYDWEGNIGNDWGKAWLDAAAENGLMALVALHRDSTYAANFDKHSADRIALYRNHPALLAWHTMDEPQWEKPNAPDGKKYMPLAYQFVKKHDPNHPVTAVLCHFVDPERFVKDLDIFQADHYPVPAIPAGDFAGTGFAGIKMYPDLCRKASDGKKPMWFVCQAYDNSLCVLQDKGVPKEFQRFPTTQELRTMSYSAIAAGARGVFYWSLSRLKSEVRPGGPTAEDHWNRLQSVTLELKALSPVLTANTEETLADKDSVVSMVKPYGKYVYVIAANYERKPTETTIDIPGVKKAVAKPVFSGKAAKVIDGKLPLKLDSIESVVYRIRVK